MLILIGAVPERLVHGDQSRLLVPSSLAPPGPAVGFSTATLIQSMKSESLSEKLFPTCKYFTTFIFFFPGSQTNKNLPVHLVFNITDLPSTEIIRKCELHIYRKKSRNLSKEQKRHPHFHMIKVHSPGIKKSVDEKLLSSKGFGWQQFDVTQAVKHALRPKFLVRDILLKLSVAQVQRKQQKVKFKFVFDKNHIKEPLLVVYTDEEEQPSSTFTKRSNADVRLDRYASSVKTAGTRKLIKRSEEKSTCHRADMVVDIDKIGWDRIVQPRKFNAYRCSGTCKVHPSSLVIKSNHAIIQTVLSDLSDIDPPCCSPKELQSRNFLVIEKQEPRPILKLKQYTRVVVKSCACL